MLLTLLLSMFSMFRDVHLIQLLKQLLLLFELNIQDPCWVEMRGPHPGTTPMTGKVKVMQFSV